MADSSIPPPTDRPPLTDEARDALRWHGAWAVAIVISLVVLTTALHGLDWLCAAALIIGAAPGVAGTLLSSRDLEAWRVGLLGLWAVCGAAACLLAGGLAGPLAVWCLAPAAAATVLAAPNALAQGAALSMAAIAVAALARLAGLVAHPPEAPADFWIGAIGLSTTGLGLGVGLLLSRRRALRREGSRKSADGGLERLLSDQPHLILALDTSGIVLSAYGYAPEGIDGAALRGASLVDLAGPADHSRLHALIGSTLVSGAGEAVFAPAAAAGRSCAVSLRKTGEGRLAGILRDATREVAQTVALEAARDEAEALNAGKSRFVANMSHELRTPLNAVIGFSDVMRSRLFGELQPKYGEYVEMIHDAGRHLLELINDVLDISKIEAERYELSREHFDAREAISAALRLTRLQADDVGVSLRGLLPPQPLPVNADSRAVKQMVLNLVSNALKFTPKGGSVTVAVHADGEDLELVVSDTGVGIAPADLERLGRPYEQAGDVDQKRRGSGLGLSLVRALAELHGGGMSIESQLAEGTSVTVRLPVMQPDDQRPPAPEGANIIAFNPAGRAGGS